MGLMPDCDPPEIYTPEQLDLLCQFLRSLNKEKRAEVWKALPETLKFEVNYTSWERKSR